LAFAGGTLGAAIAAIGLTTVKQLASIDAPGIFRLSFGASILPRLHEVRADPTTFAIAFGVSAIAAMMFGVLPALYLSRPGPLQHAFHAASSRGGGNSRTISTIRAALVIGQVALATALLVGAGLLMQSFSRLTTVDRGFVAENVLAFQVVFPPDYSI